MFRYNTNSYFEQRMARVGSRFTKKSQGFKILQYVINNYGATKYDILTFAIGKIGTKRELRGYYSVYFQTLCQANILMHNEETFKYTITPRGCEIYMKTLLKE